MLREQGTSDSGGRKLQEQEISLQQMTGRSFIKNCVNDSVLFN